jgi:hypothetical protein
MTGSPSSFDDVVLPMAAAGCPPSDFFVTISVREQAVRERIWPSALVVFPERLSQPSH